MEIDGKVLDDHVLFTGKTVHWHFTCSNGRIMGGNEGGPAVLKLERVTRKSPTQGAKPPQGAIVLLDGKNFDEVTKGPLPNKTEQPWKIVDGTGIQVPRGGMNSGSRLGAASSFMSSSKFP